MSPSPAAFRVGPWTVEPASNRILRNDRKVRLEPKVMDVLCALCEKAGEVLSREDLLATVWPETFVTDTVLTRAISELRRALGDDPKKPTFIETIPRRGYRFLARVAVPDAEVASPTLAVLPFTDLTPGSPEDYFADGLSEMLITELAKTRGLRVISATSVRRYRATELPVPQIAAELGADYLVEGTVTRAGDDLRTTAQLIEASSDTHLWAQSFRRKLSTSLVLQGEIARLITGCIEEMLAPTRYTAEAGRPQEVDPAALDSVLRGLHFYGQRSAESVATAIHRFEETIAIEPRWAAGYGGLADCYVLQGLYGYERVDRVAARARMAAAKALELDPGSGAALNSAGAVELFFEWRAEPARALLERAIEASPSHALAHLNLADALQVLGRYEDALDKMERGFHLDPLDPGMSMNRAGFLLVCGRVEEAVKHLEKTLELSPRLLPARLLLTRTLAEWGRTREARRVLEPALDGSPASGMVRLSRAWILAAEKRRDEALAELEAVWAESSPDPPLLALARSHIFLGDLERAAWLFEKAADARVPATILVASHPGFTPLRGDPRMNAFRESVGLPALS